ncbi:hypothetical protein TRVA0_004S00496 [Trichomonascus vanleenenianus]|uniref:transcriptional regulator OPI1 n=1 Tax=Trichomonascus vanleenenianus TaxID=2268995 RepID=UPI003ECB900E
MDSPVKEEKGESPDVRLAAEALEALRTGSNNPSPASSPPPSFLAMVSSSAAKVYNSSKSYSPRFKYSAEKLEAVLPSGIRNRNVHKPSGRAHKRTPSATAASPGVSTSKSKRPAWQDMLVTATSLASLSRESRQRLRYCLHLLKLANTRLATTVNSLQELISRERAAEMAQSIAANHVPDKPATQYTAYTYTNRKNNTLYTVNLLKQDLISTIRKIVTVVSTVAGNSLPEPARSHVRSYILRLPAAWANSVHSTTASASSSAPASRDELVESTGSSAATLASSSSAPRNSHKYEIEAGSRVLSLANESLDMLQNIISVVDDTLERAETWCQRIGINNSFKRSESPTASPPSSTATETDGDVSMKEEKSVDQPTEDNSTTEQS